jgi:hypothetical protein
MKTRIAVPLFLLAGIGADPAAAFDPGNGKQLANENCRECHGTEVYTRADRRVTSRSGLTTQVQRCELALGLKWFDDEVEDVAGYLNRDFYKYGE